MASLSRSNRSKSNAESKPLFDRMIQRAMALFRLKPIADGALTLVGSDQTLAGLLAISAIAAYSHHQTQGRVKSSRWWNNHDPWMRQ